MKYLNKVFIIGNLTADPMPGKNPGTPFATFVVVTNRRWKDSSGKIQDLAEHHYVAAWGQLAEHVLQIFKKSKLVMIEGYLKTRKWEHNGAEKIRTEIVAEEVIVLSKREEEAAMLAMAA